MEVILLTKVDNLGDLGDVVKVKLGYARNYLIPYKKAKAATPENIEQFKKRKAELEKIMAEELAQAERRKQQVDNLSVTVAVKVTDEGALFGSVGTTEIIEAIEGACGEQIKRSEVDLPDGVFRETGEYEVSLRLHPDVVAVVQLKVIAEE